VRHAQSSQPTTVDFAHYRNTLKNTAIVDEAEKLLKDFKPVTYDVNAHVKAIETFEAKAVRSAFLALGVANVILFYKVAKAEEAEVKIESELKTLQQTLADIEEARPFDQLTVRWFPFLAVSHSDVCADRRCCQSPPPYC
jgi:F-type H+-transporting ATPase subunit d